MFSNMSAITKLHQIKITKNQSFKIVIKKKLNRIRFKKKKNESTWEQKMLNNCNLRKSIKMCKNKNEKFNVITLNWHTHRIDKNTK